MARRQLVKNGVSDEQDGRRTRRRLASRYDGKTPFPKNFPAGLASLAPPTGVSKMVVILFPEPLDEDFGSSGHELLESDSDPDDRLFDEEFDMFSPDAAEPTDDSSQSSGEEDTEIIPETPRPKTPVPKLLRQLAVREVSQEEQEAQLLVRAVEEVESLGRETRRQEVMEESTSENKRGFKSAAMIGTLFNYKFKPSEFINQMPADVRVRIKFAAWQCERSPETGALHIQWYIVWRERQWSKVLFGMPSLKGIYIALRRGTHRQARDYCTKEESRFEGPWTWGEDIPEKEWDVKSGTRTDIEAWQEQVQDLSKPLHVTAKDMPQLYQPGWLQTANLLRREMHNDGNKEAWQAKFAKFEPNEWQKEVLQLIDEPMPRKIIWVWERDGNRGKSTFTKYLSYMHNAQTFSGGAARDISCALDQSKRIFVFDFPRSTTAEFVSYNLMEQLKNGEVFDHKYMSGHKFVHPDSHVICFANWEPDYTKLSMDRWEIVDINDAPSY